MELCILIPAKNEESSLPKTIADLNNYLNVLPFFNILVVNDHSEDKTLDVLKNMSYNIPNLYFVDNESEKGVGNAIRFGLDRFKGDVVAICMADGSDNPKDVLESFLLISEEGYDCVFGSRFIKGGSVKKYPIAKLILNRIFNVGVKLLTSYKHNDFTNIFKVYKRSAIEIISPLESTQFNIGLEMSMKAFRKKLKIATLPISWEQRTMGVSKLNLKKNAKFYFLTLKNLLRIEK